VARIRVSQASIVGAAAVWLVSIAVAVSAQAVKNPEAAKLKNPTKATPESIAAGQAVYQKYCKFCHNDDAKGDGPLAPKGTHPPNLVDATWDHGSTDGEIFTNIKEGIGPKYDMKAMKAKMMDADIWNVVNYLHSIGPKTK
jgi:mono/diheme cytochrome c family protein